MKVPRVTVELTPQEIEEEKKWLGVRLPRRFQARYKQLHALKVLQRREMKEDKNWEQRCWPK